MKNIATLLLLLAACSNGGPAVPPEPRPALIALLVEDKFQPSEGYTGADTPEDLRRLQSIVNGAIRDIAAMSRPINDAAVRKRLTRVIGDVDMYATEDREQAYRYIVHIWRAAGLKGNTGLFPVPDEKMLENPFIPPPRGVAT